MKNRLPHLLMAALIGLAALLPASVLAGGGGSSPRITIKNAARKTVSILAGTCSFSIKGGYYTKDGGVPVQLTPGNSFSDDYKGCFDIEVQGHPPCNLIRFSSSNSQGTSHVLNACYPQDPKIWADITYTKSGDDVSITVNAVSDNVGY